MALIACPNCNNEISDKAKQCPKCGYSIPLTQDKQFIKCEECGTEFSPSLDVCPNCGCPKPENKAPQKVEVTNVKIGISKKKRNIILILVFLICGCIVGGYIYKTSMDKKKEDAYLRKYTAALETGLYGAALAESNCNLIRSVWRNTIYEKDDSTTDKYTKDKYGVFHDDFNTSLDALLYDTTFISKVGSIIENKEEMEAYMKDLKSPPEKYKEAFNSFKEFYDDYQEIVRLGTDPSGSLSSYSDAFSAVDSDIMKKYDAAKLYVD